MATGKGKQPAGRGNGQGADFKGFVNLELSAEEKKLLKESPFDLGIAEDTLIKLVESGYKVTFNYDTFNNCYGVFIIPSAEKNRNAGYILPGRGSTPIKALKQAAYKHFHLLEADWTEAQVGKREDIDD